MNNTSVILVQHEDKLMHLIEGKQEFVTQYFYSLPLQNPMLSGVKMIVQGKVEERIFESFEFYNRILIDFENKLKTTASIIKHLGNIRNFSVNILNYFLST